MTDDNLPATTSPNQPRRGSFTSNTFTALFGTRSNSVSGPSPAPVPTPTAPRRLSINTLGLSGSPTQTSSPFFPRDRRSSLSTSASTDDSAIDDEAEPSGRTPPSPFAGRRTSLGAQALLSARGGSSPGASGRGPPLPAVPDEAGRAQASTQPRSRTLSDLALARAGSDGLDWSEQFRSRAESAVQHQRRPSFGAAAAAAVLQQEHERARSIGEVPAETAMMLKQRERQLRERQLQQQQQLQQQKQQKPRKERRKPDEVGERMLRGEFYMD